MPQTPKRIEKHIGAPVQILLFSPADKMKRTNCLLFLFLTCCISLQGQTIHFKHLDMKAGLSTNQVNDVALDHHGFLILATDQGLCKYDGREVTLQRQGDIKGFETLELFSICKDHHEDIWIGSSRGLFKMDKSGKITPIYFPKPDTTIVSVRF